MENKNRTVEVKELPEMTLAYIRHVGPYIEDSQLFERLTNRLFKWAGQKGLLNFPDTKFIIIYHDNPEITGKDKQRVSVCITAPDNTQVDGKVEKMTLPAGKYALARFELLPHEYKGAWEWVYGEWLPHSGYAPDNRPRFELMPNADKKGPNGEIVVDICIAIKPL